MQLERQLATGNPQPLQTCSHPFQPFREPISHHKPCNIRGTEVCTVRTASTALQLGQGRSNIRRSLAYPSRSQVAMAVTTGTQHVGIANLPNQRHRIVSRKGANFTVMVVGMYPFYHCTSRTTRLTWPTGESGLGKTTFINTLFTTLLREYKKPEHRFQKQLERTVQIDVVRAGAFGCYPMQKLSDTQS